MTDHVQRVLEQAAVELTSPNSYCRQLASLKSVTGLDVRVRAMDGLCLNVLPEFCIDGLVIEPTGVEIVDCACCILFVAKLNGDR